VVQRVRQRAKVVDLRGSPVRLNGTPVIAPRPKAGALAVERGQEDHMLPVLVANPPVRL